MTRLRWLMCLLGILVLAAIYLNAPTEQHGAARAAAAPADWQQRIETLELRVAALESQLSRAARVLPPTPSQSSSVPRHWQKREFNGQPVYIIPLSAAEPKD